MSENKGFAKVGELELFETGKGSNEKTEEVVTLKNLRDLCDYFSAETPGRLPKRIYKGTDCGAWIGLMKKDGKYIYEDEIIERKTFRGIKGFKIGTIVEGWDGEGVMAGEWEFPVSSKEVDVAMMEMESEAAQIWECANEHPPGCECGFAF